MRLTWQSMDRRSKVKAPDESAALTEEIAKVEREIDERVAALYGL